MEPGVGVFVKEKTTGFSAERLDAVMDLVEPCGAMCGPIWKLGGETCSCIEPAGHVERQDGKYGADHVCSCGAWFVDSVARYPRKAP